ncbi:MAG: phosphatidate cytidylyltransferase [Gammaproteobacteria bacterium]|nr:phosphatidate cytidylyltransferase [Gammaproteobacteria bacterium]
MLKQRIITAFILIPLVVWGVLGLPSLWLAFLFAPFVFIGAWEWSRLIPLNSHSARLCYLLLMLLLLMAVGYFMQNSLISTGFPMLASLFWALSIFWLGAVHIGRETSAKWVMIKSLLGLLILSSCWLSVLLIHAMPANGPSLLLTLLIVIWATDSGAYFSGRQWGRHKLAPQVSPKKTWEGFWGGCFSGLLVALVSATILGWENERLLQFVLLALFVIIASVIGDLFESLLKRHQNIKDSGNIFPGHGGVLDRIDSLTAAAPVYLLGLYWIGA